MICKALSIRASNEQKDIAKEVIENVSLRELS